MAKQINKAQSTKQFDLPAFLENGAVLQLTGDQFKLISGPFDRITLNENEMNSDETLVFRPTFWDFLRPDSAVVQAFRGRSVVVLTRESFQNFLADVDSEAVKVSWQNVQSLSFKQQFEWSQRQFAEKKLLKTVPIISQFCKTRFTKSNLATVLQKLITEKHFGWAYGFWEKGEGLVGQSPELICQWQKTEQLLRTTALAGTLRNAAGQEAAMWADKKIRTEHEIVVQDMEQTLNEILPSTSMQKSSTEILALKHLLHFKTEFRCHPVTREQALQILRTLPPTAALGLYPRNIEETKIFSEIGLQKERGSFAAPFAFIEKDQILAVASIRNFFFSAEGLTVFSGCGVTAESHFETELAELEMKRESVKRMMGIAE